MELACQVAILPLETHGHTQSTTSLPLERETYQVELVSDRTPSQHWVWPSSTQRCGRAPSGVLLLATPNVKTSCSLPRQCQLGPTQLSIVKHQSMCGNTRLQPPLTQVLHPVQGGDIGAMVSYIFTYHDSRTIRMLGCDVHN